MTNSSHARFAGLTGPRIALAAFVLLFAAWAGLEIYLRRKPLPQLILTGGPPAKHLAERWSPCCEVRNENGASFIVSTEARKRDIPEGYREFRFPLERGAGAFRIALVGESSAAILGTQMQSALGTPDGPVQVLNCASGGAVLAQVEKRWDEIRRYRPDAAVLMFGHNDDEEMYFPAWRLGLNGALSRSRLVIEAARRFAARFPRRKTDFRAAPSRYEAFLRRAAADARRDGRPLLVCTVVFNCWFPPPASAVHGEPELLRATLLHWAGRDDQAFEALRGLIRAKDAAYWHFLLGDWLHQRGDLDGARRELRYAQTGFGGPGPERNEISRRVAKEFGLRLIETQDLFERLSPDGILGWHFMRDMVHLDPSGNQELANACLAALGRPERFAPVPREAVLRARSLGYFRDTAAKAATPHGCQGIEYLVGEMLSEKDGSDVVREMLAFQWVPQSMEPGAFRTALLLAGSRGYWRNGRRAEALALCEEAARNAPGSAAPRLQRGLYELRLGRTARALAEFRAALAIAPADPETAAYAREAERLFGPASR